MPLPYTSRVVSRPVPKAQTEDPKAFQLGQMERRFKPKRSEANGNTILKFQMQPSDPDFPYEIDALECLLTVPASHPQSDKPKLSINNKDIPRGFQINIEQGFTKIAVEAPTATLLGLMNRLDRQLETILSGREADTVKIVVNKPEPKQTDSRNDAQPMAVTSSLDTATKEPSEDQVAAAQQQRRLQVRQLEARFSKVPLFSKASNGSSYTVPLDSPKRLTWPSALQTVKSVRLSVPDRYPLEPADVHVGIEAAEARAVESAFKQRSKDLPGSTLTSLVNYLSQNMKAMSSSSAAQQKSIEAKTTSEPEIRRAPEAPLRTVTKPPPDDADSHIHRIPRPIEWDQAVNTDSGSTDDSDSSESEHDDPADDGTEEAGGIDPPSEPTSSAPAERGILLSFPQLELHGVELLELTSLQITVKCERCKETLDVSRLRSTGENSEMRGEHCKKCAAGIAIRYRADLIHSNSVRAGYIDLEGATVVDMLPSNFMPTCAECSTVVPAPGVVAVRGDSALAVCRECHRKMSFRIVEVKFLHISAATIRASLAPARKKARENLGITAGTELPGKGRCSHYRKSYRWFRFSCCNKVYACDRCHDEKSDHPNEWANRMLCGYCSREQNYRPEDCGICHAGLTGKRGRGFWEGGKGTRDPTRMSKKDPRKYKRRPGTVKPTT